MYIQLDSFNSDMVAAHSIIMRRYLELIQKSNMHKKDHWIKFCETALTLKNSDKFSRWIGFIQGVLYAEDLISIDVERDFTREIYKPIYIKWELDSETISV